MKFYACVPDKKGGEPLGSSGKFLFELKTIGGAIRKCLRFYRNKAFRLYTYTNFYNDNTFKLLHEKKGITFYQAYN